MLDKEDYIEKHSKDREQELDDVEALITVSKERLPLEDCLNRRLHEREKSAKEVEHHVGETPSDSRLALPVQIDLRHVLDECDCRFNVAGHSNRAVLLVDCGLANLSNEEGAHYHGDHDEECYYPQIDRRLFAAVIHKDLR